MQVATIDGQGTVLFLTSGQATFTARTAHRSASATITAFPRQLVALDAGRDFMCGFAPLGRGYCWGRETVGQTASAPDSSCFADLNTTEGCSLPPKRMQNPQIEFTTVSAGGEFGCGIDAQQALYCWGTDEVGQRGNGFSGGGPAPGLATVNGQLFTTVSAGEAHACALSVVGTGYCWGSDDAGQLGDTTLVHSTTPIPVADTTLVFTSIAAGGRHTCGIVLSGAAYCWGDGALGLGNTTMQLIPTLTLAGGGFTHITAGGDPALNNGHTCGIANGFAVCWGDSAWGQVGSGVVNGIVTVPSQVSGAFAATSISAGASHTCAISAASGLSWCWGSNRWGALGNELQAAPRATPQLIARPR